MTEPVRRVIVVTGASRGLGREIALAFGRAGERVAVNFRESGKEASEVAETIARSGGEAVACRADVRSAVDVDALFSRVIEQWGRVDVLVNNAGLARDGLCVRMSEQDWDDVIGTNLTGPFSCIRSASKVMMKQRSGHIVNIASIAGVQGREGQANYAASKAGLIGLTKSAAKELGRFNIRVNAVLPGYLSTEMGGGVSHVMRERILEQNALGRPSDSAKVASFILHLASMNNVSGQVFNLDSRVI